MREAAEADAAAFPSLARLPRFDGTDLPFFDN